MKLIAPLAVLLALANLSAQEPPKKAAKTPAERQEEFLAALKAGKIEKSYEDLVKGSPVEEKPDQVDSLIQETDKGIKMYGGAVGVETFGIVRQEKHQAFGVGLLRCEKAALFFYFIWYRKEESSPWILTGAWFNDSARDYWMLRR